MKRWKHPSLSRSLQIMLCSIILVLVLFPFIWMILSSFKMPKDILKWPPTIIPKRWTYTNYVKICKRLPIAQYFLNSVIFAAGGAAFSAVLDSMAGYAFARLHFKGRDTIFNIVLLTMLVPFQIIMIPLYIEMNWLRLLNTYVGLLLPRIASAYGIFFMRASFQSLPGELQEAARIDGMGEFGIFWKIMFPLCKAAFITFFIFSLNSNWNELLYPMMMTNSANMRTISAGLAMFVTEGFTDNGAVMAGTLISMLPLFALYCVAQRYFVEGIAVSGMKG